MLACPEVCNESDIVYSSCSKQMILCLGCFPDYVSCTKVMMPLDVLVVLLACLLSYYLGSCSAVFSAFVVQPVQSQY